MKDGKIGRDVLKAGQRWGATRSVLARAFEIGSIELRVLTQD